jgi:hemoglobin
MTLFGLLAACGGSPKPAESAKTDTPAVDSAKADTMAPDAGAMATDTKPAEAAAKPDEPAAAKDTAPAGNCTKDMFKKYGEEAFLKVNDSIIAKAVAAPVDKVGPTFKKLAKNKAEAAKVKKHLAELLVKVYGGPDNYKGRDMETTHKGMKITSDQYDWFIGNVVVAALKENGVSDDDIKNCFAPPVTDTAFKASIIGR